MATSRRRKKTCETYQNNECREGACSHPDRNGTANDRTVLWISVSVLRRGEPRTRITLLITNNRHWRRLSMSAGIIVCIVSDPQFVGDLFRQSPAL